MQAEHRQGAAARNPAAIERLKEDTLEVAMIGEIGRELLLCGNGPRDWWRSLSKSGLVLTIACWEAFIEDTCRAAFEQLLARADHPRRMPRGLIVPLCRRLREAKNETQVLSLAGEGWRDEMRIHAHNVLERFHSASSTKVDQLMLELLGIPELSRAWHWRGMSGASARRRLNGLIVRRGEIVHRYRPSRPARQQEVDEALALVSRLAEKTSNAVAGYLRARGCGKGWGDVQYLGMTRGTRARLCARR